LASADPGMSSGGASPLPEAWRAPTPSGWTSGRAGGASAGTAVYVLAATDPAQPFGAALPWPPLPQDNATGHKPGRKAGAVVVLVGTQLVLYLERGGKSLLAWTDNPQHLCLAGQALRECVQTHRLPALTLERLNGQPLLSHPLAPHFESAGFTPTPRGLRLRG
jgi:ATP-dependent Lhr-like helicase